MNIAEILDMLAVTRAQHEPIIAAIESEIGALKVRLAEHRRILQQAEDLARAALLLNMREEGEMNPDADGWVTAARRVRYNRDAALALALQKYPTLVRTQHELKVRECDQVVEAWIAAGTAPSELNAGVETVYIANISSKLGHRIIAMEMENANAAGHD